MPILELSQREFQKLRKSNVIDISGNSTDPRIHLEVSQEELQLIRDAQVIWLDGEEVPVTLGIDEFRALQREQLFPVIGTRDGETVICNFTRNQWRLYQKFKLKSKRAARKERKETPSNTVFRKGVSCPDCGLVLLNYEKMIEHHKTHDKEEVKYLFTK